MEVLSDPYGELPMRNNKYAGLCTELHLGDRSLTSLASFEAFHNLTVLWLNNNHLREIRGLEHNIRLKHLYLHSNSIQRLSNSCIKCFKFLETLNLSSNQLSSLSDVLDELKYLKHLKVLELSDNPIAQEDNYRLLVIGNMLWLQSLDRIPITEKEKKDSKKLLIQLKSINNLHLKSSSSSSHDPNAHPNANPNDSSLDSDSNVSNTQQNRLLKLLIPRITQLFQRKRIYFKDYCLQYDRRRLGLITEDSFRSCLIEYGIYSELSEEEYQTLLKTYMIPTRVPAINLGINTLKDNRLVDDMIQYERFCQDTLPTDLSVTQKPMQSYNPLQYSTERVPEISHSVKDLIQTVTSYEKTAKEQAEKSKKATLFASDSENSWKNFTFQTDNSSNSSFSSSGLRSSSSSLDPWLMGQLRSFLLEISSSILQSSPPSASAISTNKKPMTLLALSKHIPEIQWTSSHLETLLNQMESYGKTIRLPNSPSLSLSNTKQQFIQQLFSKNSLITLSELCQLFQIFPELSQQNTAAASQRPPSSPNGLKKINFQGGFLSSLSLSKGIEWRNLTENEIKEKERKEFQNASEYLEKLLRDGNNNSEGKTQTQTAPQTTLPITPSGGGGGGKGSSTSTPAPFTSNSNDSTGQNNLQTKRQKELTKLAFESSVTGTRMASTRLIQKNQKIDDSPARIIQTAPNRSDILVIPSLKSAALRHEEEEVFRKTYNWETHLKSLGLKNEALEIAMNRKQKSLSSTSNSNTTATNTNRDTTNTRTKNEKSINMTTSLSQTSRYHPKGDEIPKKGWASSTGTLVFK